MTSFPVAILITVVVTSPEMESLFKNDLRILSWHSTTTSRTGRVLANCQHFACHTLGVPRTPSRSQHARRSTNLAVGATQVLADLCGAQVYVCMYV